MFSKAAVKQNLGWEEGFRWRGKDVSRIEGFSDAVFGLAVTLLVISSEVPHTYPELVKLLWSFIPFAACFAQLMIVWFEHYKFYRRYGLQDIHTTMWSLVLLCIVLFYVYPLKFLFSSWMLPDQYPTTAADIPGLFTIYGVGFISVFLVFFFMYRRALSNASELNLTEVEIWDTKHSIRETYINISVAVISITIANTLEPPWIILAGPIYSICGFGAWWHGEWSSRKKKVIYSRGIVGTVE